MRRRKGLSFYQKQSKISTALIHEIMSWFFGCVIAVLLAFVLVFYFGMSTSVIGISMEPTLSGGQSVLIDRFLYTFMAPKQGDVIAFLPNGDSNICQNWRWHIASYRPKTKRRYLKSLMMFLDRNNYCPRFGHQ